MAGRDWLDAVLGLGPEWKVTRVEPSRTPKELRVELHRTGGSPLRCPHCGEACPGYDTRRREWRNLDAWGYKTFLVCNVPRVQCPEHGVVTIRVPWAEGSSRYTAQFEAEVIGWLKEASVKAVAGRMRLSWNAVDGIMQRAVARGLARRKTEAVRRLSVDETSFRRRHRYVTVVSNPESGHVLHVAPGRGRDVLTAFYEGLGEKCRAAVESVSMDMWAPYISATLAMIPDAVMKIAFDRFHVAKHLGDAVDKVRWAEHRALVKEGNGILVGTKWQWLKGPSRKTHAEKLAFARLRAGTRRTAQAWELKEAAANLWNYRSRTWALAGWHRWLDWASGCGLEPVLKAARMIRDHRWGIVNAIILRATNGPAEGINSRIKTVKVRSRGFRNRERFANAILFHLGGLDLYPDGLRA